MIARPEGAGAPAGGGEAPAELAIVIVSANDGRWLESCLRSIYEHTGGASVEVVVVDNESSDGTAEVVRAGFPRARVLSSPNLGFGYGNNRGLESTDARFVLFLNPDTEIREGTFAALLEHLDEHPEVGLVGVRQLTGDGLLWPTMRRFPSVGSAIGEALFSEHWPASPAWARERVLDRGAYAHERECDWTAGSFMLVRREALLGAGAFDERFFIFSEEPDLCLRIKRAGWRIRHLPQMTIVHHAGKAGVQPRLIAQTAYARRQYACKHFDPLKRRAYLAAVALGHAIRAMLPGIGPDGAARRAGARRALGLLAGRGSPPFAEPPATAWTGAARPRPYGPPPPS